MDWRPMAALKKKQREATFRAMKLCVDELPKLPVVVTITRVAPRTLDDDNLQAACKYVRDEIAKGYGVDDGSTLYTWLYSQRKGNYGVLVDILATGDQV